MPTPNHEYSQPSKGTQDWNKPLNQNFADIDADVELRDSGPPGSNGYDPTAGAKYLDTDTGLVYTADGSTWTAAFVEARYTPPDDADDAGSVVFGHPLNSVGGSVAGATVGGGGRDTELAGTPPQPNSVTGSYGTVSGGFDNTASAGKATVSGGADNTADATNATVGGGVTNTATAESATVAGGRENESSGQGAAVGGGYNNRAEAEYATIAGGGPADPENRPGGTNNIVHDNYGTVGGGGNNQAGSETVSATDATHATVAGGDGNTASGKAATVSGGQDNTASTTQATVGGGDINTASATQATVGGGFGNTASATQATVGGGEQNTAGAEQATVGGGEFNSATGTNATVGGGSNNTASAEEATVGGGFANAAEAKFATIAGGGPTAPENDSSGTNNVVYDNYGTVGGGGDNQAGSDDGNTQDPTNATYATVAGGQTNVARGFAATVGGGQSNTAGGSFGGTDNDQHQTVAGGTGNEASAEAAAVGGGSNNEASGSFAAVPGGQDNAAQADYSVAAGRRAKAQNPGSFVFADSNDTDVTTSGDDEFVVQAAGGVGLSTTADLDLNSNVHLSGIGGNDQTSPSSYSVLVENNTNALVDTGIALAVQMDIDSPNRDDNYIGFFDSTGTATGAIEGSSSGDGINFNSTSADYAEYMPRLDAEERIEPGDVVGVVGDAVTRDTAGASRVMVVSDQPLVTGNAPGVDSEARTDHEIVAFVGQVPVKVRGSVAAGDLLVPSGRADGTAEAIAPAAWRPGEGPLVGRALEGDDTEGVSRVQATVGVDDPTVLGDRLDEYRERIAEMERENDQLRERLAAVEDRLAAVESQQSSPAPADD